VILQSKCFLIGLIHDFRYGFKTKTLCLAWWFFLSPSSTFGEWAWVAKQARGDRCLQGPLLILLYFLDESMLSVEMSIPLGLSNFTFWAKLRVGGGIVSIDVDTGLLVLIDLQARY